MPKVVLPKLHKLQQEVYDHPATFKVLACGRRFGKSLLAQIVALDVAINHGGTVWWLAPTYKTSSTHWRTVKHMIEDAPFLHYKNEQERYLEFRIGNKIGSLTFKSGDKYDNLRGAGLDLAILDEAAFMSSDVWYEAIAPSLADKQGSALFLSTPSGRNWFYDLFQLGNEDSPRKDKNWQSWQFPTTDNPYVDKEYVKMMSRNMPKQKFQQEFLAKFLENSGGVFHGLQEVFTNDYITPLDVEEQLANDTSYVIGVDWARKNDFTVISVFDRSTGAQVDLARYNDTNFSVQLDHVSQMIDKWQPMRVFVEENSIGMPQVERLQRAFGKTLIRNVYMTNPKKKDIIERLAVAVELGNVSFLKVQDANTEQQYDEFSNYEVQYTRGGMSVTYNAPRKMKDDCVMAAALAWSGVKRPMTSISFTDNVFY